LAPITDDDEAFRVWDDFFDVKTVTWVVGYWALNLTIVFAQDYLSLVGAYENFALG